MAQTAFCKIIVNSFEMGDEEENPVADGIGLLASAFDHSCWPNATHLNEGRKNVIRAIDKIDSMTDVRITYWVEAPGLPVSIRRDLLEKSHFFKCECDECNMVNPGSHERETIRYGH